MREHQFAPTPSGPGSSAPGSSEAGSPGPASPGPASYGAPCDAVSQTPPSGPQEPGQPPRGVRSRGGGPRGAVVLLWVVAVLVVLVDQATKAWALTRLSGGRQVAVVGDLLGLVLVRNPGAAFSLASGYTWILALVAVVVVGVLLRASRRLASTWWAVVLGLVLGGAVGNLADRLFRPPGFLRGHVIDFISYNGRFVGNVADVAIVVAAVGVVVLSLLGRDLDGTRGAAGDPGGTEDPGAGGAVAAGDAGGRGLPGRRGSSESPEVLPGDVPAGSGREQEGASLGPAGAGSGRAGQEGARCGPPAEEPSAGRRRRQGRLRLVPGGQAGPGDREVPAAQASPHEGGSRDGARP